MPHAELLQWQEYAALEPFGSHFDDLRAGAVAAAVVNIGRDVKKFPDPVQPLDFTPWNAMAARQQEERQAIQLDDPDAAAALFDAVFFGKAPEPVQTSAQP